MTPTSAPGTGRDRCLTIRGRRGRRKTRKILDNDPAGCYIRGQRRGTPCVRRAPPPQQCVADGETVQLWGALPVRPLPETSPRHAPCPLPPRSGGPLGPPAPPVSPRPAALGHRPRRARGWPPAPRRLGDPPRVPAGLDPCRGAPGGRGASRTRRGRWRTRDLQRATGGASAPPGVRRPAAPRLRHATALAGTVSVRGGPCGGVPHPALASACPHAAGAGPGRAGARHAGEAGGARQPHAPHAARAGDPSCPARGRGVLWDFVLSRGPCWTPPATGAGPPARGPEAPRAAAGGPPAARAACPPPGARRDLWPTEPWGAGAPPRQSSGTRASPPRSVDAWRGAAGRPSAGACHDDRDRPTAARGGGGTSACGARHVGRTPPAATARYNVPERHMWV